MNEVIREAARGAQPSRVLHALAPELPPGRSSVGVGVVIPPPYRGGKAQVNEAIREGIQLARSLTLPHGLDLGDLFNS